jgi:predicted TIM-barrel fold metal-dependent hydrolase
VIVDTHVHVVSDDLARHPLRPGVATNPWYETHPCSGPALRALMAEAEVDAAVLVQGVGAYGFDNSYVMEAAGEDPGRFTPVVCTDRSRADAVAEVQALVAGGARGYRWFCVGDDDRIEEPRALWDALGALRVPVVPTFLPDGFDPFARIAATYPHLTFAVDHVGFVDLGGGIPDALGALAGFANVYLKVSTHALHTAAANGDPADAVAELAARFDGRIMWGSDWSQTHHAPYPDIVEEGRVAARKLSAVGRDAYLAGSALAVWPELARGAARAGGLR